MVSLSTMASPMMSNLVQDNFPRTLVVRGFWLTVTISEQIANELCPAFSYVEYFGNGFKVTIKDSKKESSISLFAKPISECSDICLYASETGNMCTELSRSYTYCPINKLSIVEAVAKRKLYGVIDSFEWGPVYAITIMQQCYSNHVSIGVPIMFCLSCKNDCCAAKGNGHARNGFRRQIVRIERFPIVCLELTGCVPRGIN